MVDERLLRGMLVMVFEHLKMQREDLFSLANEVAALREAIDEASRERFLALLQRHREAAASRAAASEADSLQGYDEILRRLRAGEVP
jgi:hypothetical protein